MRLFIYLFFILTSAFLLSACEQAVNTPDFTTPTVASTVTITQAIVSTVTPVVTTPTAVILAPMLPTLAQYQGSNPYREHPRFALAYNPMLWSLIGDEGTNLGKRLIHNTIAGCYLRLESGPMGALSIAQISLAGREWTISQLQSKILRYSSNEADIAFIFDLILPEEYSPTTKSTCQVQAEEVIDTFQMIE